MTLASVRSQTCKPARHMVIDSSRHIEAARAMSICEEFGAEYIWTQPEGIYQAMDFSLSLLAESDYVLWLNSSDRLAGKRVLCEVNQAVKEFVPNQGPSWIVCGLLKARGAEFRVQNLPSTGNELVERLSKGTIGFAHPSTIFLCSAVVSVGGYVTGTFFRVANDYDLALRMSSRFGAPLISRRPLSIHELNGHSSRHPARGFVEKIVSRLRRLGMNRKLQTAVLIPWLLLKAVFRRITHDAANRVSPDKLFSSPDDHFCDFSRPEAWPECCRYSLEVAPD